MNHCCNNDLKGKGGYMANSGAYESTDNNTIYVPGMYQKEKPNVQEMIEKVYNDWQLQRKTPEQEKGKQFPVICFSRRIGVGALEIADILADQIGYRVIDREILEYLANQRGAHPLLDVFNDENNLSEMEDVLTFLFGVKTYTESEYSRLLFRAIFSFADLGPTIFVGRGAHLILPRERVLAVRLVCSDSFRCARIAGMLKISESEALVRLKQLDDEQRRFFHKIYGIQDDYPEEYDITISRDFFINPAQVAEIIKTVLKQKFGSASRC